VAAEGSIGAVSNDSLSHPTEAPRGLLSSAWLRRTLEAWDQRRPELRADFDRLCQQPIDRTAIESLLQSRLQPARDQAGPERATGIALRQTRQVIFAALLERDVSGLATLAEVCSAMTDLAEIAVGTAIRSAANDLIKRFGQPRDAQGEAMDLLVVGMGKLGGRELNVSSDIDLVLIYRDEGRTAGGPMPSISCAEFFARVSRAMIQLLDPVTEDGFVFRIDLRLRPYGDSGPAAMSLPALEDYLVEQGREWERFAWLKSRLIADTGITPLERRAADHAALTALVQPFVWRRYLDFGAFDALRDLHTLIRNEAAKREVRRGGIDVKLGRGGIREIEFIAQLFQIVRGGRDPDLRHPSTLTTLSALNARGLLPHDECESLADDYTWLRRVEHALQYREDAQTHTLSDDPDARAQTAQMLGSSVEDLETRLHLTRQRVAAIFDALLRQSQADAVGPATPVDMAGLPDPGESPQLTARIDAIRTSRRWVAARPETRVVLERLILRARRRCHTDDPAAWVRLIDLFESVLGRPSYLMLMDRFPAVLDRLVRTVAQSQWGSNYLLRHPVVLDELLDGEVLKPVDYARWGQELGDRLEQIPRLDGGRLPDVERQMDLAREAHHAQVFRLLVQDLEGRLTIEHLSDHLSELADRVLALAIPLVWSQLRNRHAVEPRFAVIAYGRLGSMELGYASDLDLVFLYDDPDPRAAECYAALAQRLMGWLSSRTAAGLLFEVDLRLRPNGNSGLLVSSLEAFARYQRESAWVWEHQALTRARHCAGLQSINPWFEALRRELLAKVRGPAEVAELARKILDMRHQVAAGHPNRSELFDLKHDRGGLIDVEFTVQFLVLAHSARDPALLDDVGNIALLERAAQGGLIPPELAEEAADAYRRYRALQHRLRLDDSPYARVPHAQVAREIASVTALWQTVFGAA
jgi:glutamate-ammonia-ligase adenylyltransferase